MTKNNALLEITVSDIVKMHEEKIQQNLNHLVNCIQRCIKNPNVKDFNEASDILQKEIKFQIDKIESIKSVAQLALWFKESKQNVEQHNKQDLEKETSQSKE